MRCAAILLGALCVAGSRAGADEMQADLGSTEWACGAVVKLPKDRSATILDQAEAIGSAGATGAKPFLILDVPDIFDETESDTLFGGTMLATKGPSGWDTYAIESGGGIQRAKRTADGRRVVIVSMLGRGDPGGAYTIVSTQDGFSSFTCAEVVFPNTLNKPNWVGEYLQFGDFNGSDDGKLTLVGSVTYNREEAMPDEYYRYESADGGVSWVGPTKLESNPGKLSGDMVEVDTKDMAKLKAELAASAR